MEFRILGPLEVWDGDRAIDVGAAKVRALLAVFCLNPNRVVSTDGLIEALWGERAPDTAPKALQVYVSQLRKTLGRDRILTRPPGYELRVAPGELDVHRFEQLVADEEFDEALGLWRGAPLADFAYEPFAQSERARLEELQLSCVERRIDADLAEGRHAGLVGELDGLVRDHPLRERLRAQLMLALYRSRRQADALEAYQVGRSLLSEELGLEPSSELKELQRQILSQDAALDLPDRAPAEQLVVVEPGRSPAPRGRQTRKSVTVLSCDVTVTGGELDPESLARVTARGLDEVVPVLERHGATVESSLGGAVSAVFGIPVVNEDDPLRAVRAAIESHERIAGLDDELAAGGSRLALRVGIGTGEVVAASDGARPSAAGQPVQEAIRLQQAANPGELLIDERTLHVVRAFVEVETLDDRVRLVSVSPVERGLTGRTRAPMVGRDRELRRLHDAFEQARSARSCQLFTVLGAPGVGKSRLVSEFVGAIAESALVARGRCLPYGEGITYWPILEAVRDAAELDDAAPPEANLAKLGAILEGTAESKWTAERLGELVGQSDRLSTAEEIAAAIHSFVEALARRRPLVLVFDDIHWGEATFLDLMDHIADWVTDAPLLLVCIARPELLEVRAQWGGGKRNATSVLLEPLSDDESESLVHTLAGADGLDEATCRRIVEAAGGNPFFVEEMLALLLEDDRDRDVLEVPATIQSLLATRLDRLSDDERATLEAAAVEGKVFHQASVVELTSVEAGAIREALSALARRDLIRDDRPVFSGERAYRFRHLLIRDAAYESIPKANRSVLHERHAAWLESNVGERALELDEIVGYHYEQAFRYRVELGTIDDATRALGSAAATRLGSAGRRALVRSDGPAGVNLISRSVALLSPDDPFRVELIPNVRVIQGLSDLSWADRVLTEAIEAAATSGDRSLAAHALVQRGFLRLFTDEGVTSRELFDVSERAITVFESLGDELGLARAWRLASQAHYLDGRPGLCAEASERAWAHARRASDRFEEREIVEWLVIVLLLGPTPAAEATARLESLLDETADIVEVQAQIHAGFATLAAMRGDFTRARESIERSKRIMDGLSEWIWIVTFWWGFVHLWAGELDTAEEESRPAYEALKSIGEKSHFSSIAHSLAAVAYAQGKLDEAEEFTRECENACRANDVHSQILWRAIRAKVLARRGQLDQAEGLAREAVALAERADFMLAHAEATADLGEVLELAGKPAEAIRALESAASIYERKGVVIAVTLTRARIDEIASAV
jgi:predicted ATPase/DNA-binding SARP family transcriptional activator